LFGLLGKSQTVEVILLQIAASGILAQRLALERRRPKPSLPLGLLFALFSPRSGIGLKSALSMFDTFGEIRL
jgi:hypothetical protein